MVTTPALVLIIFVIFIVAISIAGIIILWKIGRDKNTKAPPNSAIVFFLDNSVSQGYALGVILEKKEQYRNRVVLKIKPLDLQYDKKGKPIKVEPFDVAIRNKLLQSSPVGQISLYRDIWFVAPEDMSRISPEFAETPFGESILKWSALKQVDDSRASIIQQKEQLTSIETSLYGKEENKFNRAYQQLAEKAIALNNHSTAEEKK